MGLALGQTLASTWESMGFPAGGWDGLAQGLALGGVALLLWRRGRRQGGRAIASLQPQWQPRPGLASRDGLRFMPATPLSWQARRGAWRVELSRDGPDHLPWLLRLRRGDLPASWTCHALNQRLLPTHAASLAALLEQARRLGRMQHGGSHAMPPRGLQALLDCDLEFPLPHGNRLTALAEGGFALLDGVGLHGISAATADALLAEGALGAERS